MNCREFTQLVFGGFALFALVRWSILYGGGGVVASCMFAGVALFLAWLCEEDE
jgi:hypothetical protein